MLILDLVTYPLRRLRYVILLLCLIIKTEDRSACIFDFDLGLSDSYFVTMPELHGTHHGYYLQLSYLFAFLLIVL